MKQFTSLRRAALLLLTILLTATTGWAGIIYDVPYIDAEGNEQKASRYYSYKGSVQIAEGKSFKDDKGKAYRGTLTGEQLFAIEGKTLASVPPTPVQYIDENGNEKSIYEYTVLTAEMAANELPGGWYVLENSDPNYTDLYLTNTLWFNGNVNLILADGADMGVVVEMGDAINVAGKLTIYGQNNQTGELYASGRENGINAENGIVVNGGCVKAYGGDYKYGFNGGENGVDIHLKHYNSYILGSSYREPVTVSGLALHGQDNNGIYEGDLDKAQIENMAYQYQLLEPCYVVKFDKDNNTDPEFLAATFNKEGVALVARPDKPTRKGLVFYGWFTLTGSDPADENSYTRFRFDEPVTANTEVMALWKEGIRVTFRMDDGKIPEQPLIVVAEYDENGDAYVAKPEVPTREGYTFLEWVDKPQAESTSGVIRKRFDFTAPVKQNTYVYAKWWKNDPVQYVAYDPDEGKVVTKTVEDYTVLTPWTDVSKGLPAEWYIVVNSNEDEEDDEEVDLRFTKQLDFNSETTHIILMDDAQMVVGDDMNSAIHANVLNIYGQSIGSGKLVVNSDSWAIEAGSFNIYGGIVHAFGKLVGIYSYNTAHLYGGYVYVANGNCGICVNKGDLILDWTRKDDGYNINGYAFFDGGSVIVADGKYFKDSSGNIYYGTLTDAQNEALNGVTLSPATQTEYIQAHFSVNGDGTEYTIHTATGWNLFCDALQDNDTYNRFSGKTVKLGDDITVSRMAGSSQHDFCGTFDGQGNTLTVNISSDDITDGSTQYVAPFRYVSNTKADPSDEADSPATIRNLHVTGTITTDKQFTGGLIGGCWGTVIVENCRVSTAITSTISGDGTHGGIVGIQQSGALTITGCLFDGSLLGANGTTHCAGFVGYGACNITNSLYAPAAIGQDETEAGTDESATFARGEASGITIANCYYTRDFNDGSSYTGQGKQLRTIAAGEGVTLGHDGVATEYSVSGITAYKASGASGDSDPFIDGLVYNEVLYAGDGEAVSLTLSADAPEGYVLTGFAASAGTLSGNDTDGYTLTMPDQDVTISVNTAALAPIDWATVNQGNSADPYMIYNKDQLLLLAHRVNGTSGETANDYYGKYFKLGADITFSHDENEGDDYDENYEAIGGYIGGTERWFYGNFDGDGHTVSGIRIRKTGSDDANSIQGLFGYIANGAQIHNVHLTDARITGYQRVAGIVGFNIGTVSGCTVTDSYITCNDFDYGTICGMNGGTLTNNYYHGCTVNGTAVTSGKGCNGADIAANNGAFPAYRLDLGANITTPPGTFAGQTEWLDTPPVSPRLAPGNGFTLAGNHYFASGYEFTPGSTLASGAAQGYTPRATLGGQLLDLYTPTGDADPLAGKAIARLTITADCDGKTLASTEAIYSTRQPVTVAYINADGTPGEASAIALDGTETSLAAGTYFAGLENVNFDHTLTLDGDVTLILADNCHMNVGTSGEGRFNGYGIVSSKDSNTDTRYDLTITSEANGSGNGNGALSVYTTGNYKRGITANTLTINGGNVTADTDGTGASALSVDKDVTINGGTVNARTAGTGYTAFAIYASEDFNYNGGNVTATAPNTYAICADGNYTFSWRTPADRITIGATGLYADDDKTATFARLFTDASGNIYTGTLTHEAVDALAGKHLYPYIATLDLAARQAPDENYWTTFYCGHTDYQIDANENACAYTATYADGQLTLHRLGKAVPKATAVIIVADNGVVSMTAATVLPAFSGTNDLRGVNVDTPVANITSDLGEGTLYVLGMTTVDNEQHFGFHRYTGEEMAARKAFLHVPGSSNARALDMVFANEETGIGSIESGELRMENFYTLDGRKLNGKPTKPGLYINNGRKVVIK